MVTQAARLRMAARAVQCFVRQTHAARELIVVHDGISATDLKQFTAPLGGPPVFCLQAPEGLTLLGDLRNFGIARARGDYVAQWDDDDWYHPERLAVQVAALENDVAAAGCVLRQWTLAWPARDLYGISHPRAWEGSLVARRWMLPSYPAKARGEDTPVVANMQLVLIDRPDLYIYVVHGGNTWSTEHFEAMFRLITPLEPAVIARVKAQLGVS
jgi:glycosyltransferase involved in cell wall biosynthesis